MEPHGPPAAQSPAQPHDGRGQGHSSWAVVPAAAAALHSQCAPPLSAHPLWQLNCSSHTGRTACARHSREPSAHSCSARALLIS